jgi:hypothetical protein
VFKQNVGALAVRASQDAAGCDYGQYRDCRLSEEPPFGAHVPDLFGHAQENYDNKGMPSQVTIYPNISFYNKL